MTESPVKIENPEFTELHNGEVPLHGRDGAEKLSALNALGTPIDMTVFSPELGLLGNPGPTGPFPASPTSWDIPRILVCVKTLNINFKFHQSFLKFWEDCVKLCANVENPPFHIGYYFINRKPSHIADTMSVNVAKLHNCTHILFIDDDVYDFTTSMLMKLIKADKDVISGVMYTSTFPYAMCTFRRFDTKQTVCEQPNRRGVYKLYEVPCICPHCKKDGMFTNFNGNWEMKYCAICGKELVDLAVQPVDLIPFPFTLVKCSVFDRIKKPWFHCSLDFPPDSWFADRCIEAGIQEYAHMTVRLNHNDITDVTKPFRYSEGMTLLQQKGSIVSITPEQHKTHEAMISNKMEEAEVDAMSKEAHWVVANFKKDAVATPQPSATVPREQGVQHE